MLLLFLALFTGLASASPEAEAARSVYFNTTTATAVGKVATGLAVTGAIYTYLLYAASVLVNRFSEGSTYRR
jgi:hypothetical protein